MNIRLFISQTLRNSFLGDSWIYRLRDFHQDSDAVEACILKFRGSDLSIGQKNQIRRAMRNAVVCHKLAYSEYFIFHYSDLSRAEKKQFVGEYEKRIWAKRVNGPKIVALFTDKGDTYAHFKKYYGRQVVKVKSLSDKAAFESFLSAIDAECFILKPIDGSLGCGIKKVPCQSCGIESLLKDYPKGFVAEEMVVQDPEIGKLHPQSVNTLRVHTIVTRDGVKVLHPYLRMGQGGNVVDNAGAGGILTRVDEKDGIITDAVDENCRFYSIHPDTGVELIGFTIPKFREALSLAAELATVVPKAKYVGWDLALTSNGWVMIEGNSQAQFVFQIPRQEGFRKEFEELKKQM